MKLHRREIRKREKAIDVLHSEQEPNFDLRAVALAKSDEMREQLVDATSHLTPMPFMSGLLYRLASVRAVEVGLGVEIIPQAESEQWNQKAHELISGMRLLDFDTMEFDPKQFANVAAWVQLFPEECSQVAIDDKRFEGILAQLKRSTNQFDFIRESVFLLHLRPDKREQIRELVTADYFEEFVVGNFKESYLMNGIGVEKYTEWLADYLLIHPEDRERFHLNETESKIVQKALQGNARNIYPDGGRLRDAAIIFGLDAVIDDKGVIRISSAAPRMNAGRVELPIRPQV